MGMRQSSFYAECRVLRIAAVCAGLLLAVSACSVSRVATGPESDLDVLGPRPDLVTVGLDGSWKLTDTDALSALSIHRYEGIPGLRLRPLKDDYAVVRRLDAKLVVTPFLTWTWLPETHHNDTHPVRIVAGFKSGQDDKDDPQYEWFDDDLPHHDRAIEFVWVRSALSRGTYSIPDAKVEQPPVYHVRGGRESFNHWWFEALDLQALYHRAWPTDDIFKVRVSFLGFHVKAGTEDEALTISGLRLAR